MANNLYLRVALVGLCASLGCTPSADPGGGGVANECTAPSGQGVTHASDTIDVDTTWAAADGPHHITGSVTIKPGATLTIEACASVVIDGGQLINVDGALAAKGTASRPITIDGSDPTRPFGYVRAFGPVALDYTTIRHGGATDINGYGVIDVRGPGGARQPMLHVDHVTIDGSNGVGVSLRTGAAFSDDSDALTIMNAVHQPIRATPPLVQGLPAGSYTGNGADEILVVTDDRIEEDTTWSDRGVPYAIGDEQGSIADLRVGGLAGSPKATWTIEPGVSIALVPAGRIQIAGTSDASATGAIVANGTADKPIVFTSLAPSPMAGDWVGLYFAAQDAANSLSHVRVEFAGGFSGAKSFHCDLQGGANEEEDAAILVFGQPPAGFLSSSTISDSAGYGVGRAWSGTPVDFVGNNEFTNVAKCKQSYPRQGDGGCPKTIPCE